MSKVTFRFITESNKCGDQREVFDAKDSTNNSIFSIEKVQDEAISVEN